MTSDEQRLIATLLFYISPWLNRWQGTQLPIEIMCGEAGSGKSSLYMLRLSILTGRPVLRNIPTDIRDWQAGVSNSGGLYVVDNVAFTSKDIRQRISDELCRITTEPDPHVEMRRLYTTAGQFRVPVRTAFAFTSIQQPFHNSDLIQRSAVFELDAARDGHQGSWVADRLAEKGGRAPWVAHHLTALHRILQSGASADWGKTPVANHRLVHYEHCMRLAANVLGISAKRIGELLVESTRTVLSEADWALEGLKTFAMAHLKASPKAPFTASDIADWCAGEEDFKDNQQLISSRRLGRYIQAHKTMIESTTGIYEAGTYANRKFFRARTITK